MKAYCEPPSSSTVSASFPGRDFKHEGKTHEELIHCYVAGVEGRLRGVSPSTKAREGDLREEAAPRGEISWHEL